MNEEEKKAYNYLEKYINWETLGERNLEGDIKTILNLIEKQQKEIERLKDEYKREVFEYQEFVEDTKIAVQDYIKKYKIKEKMKELEEMPENQYIHLDYIKKMLEELLGE